MAVEARHLNQQHIISNRDLVNSNLGSGFVYNTQMGSGIPMPENFLPIHPKTSLNTESGLTFNMPTNDYIAPRKRSRDSFNHHFTTTSFSTSHEKLTQFPSFVGDDLDQQYQFDINSIISHHTKKIRLELEEQQKQQARMLVAAIGEKVMKKMKEKDEEIQRMGKINLVLQERLKSLYLENQLWRDLAQTNEATANSLRSNLEQVLAHVSDERLSVGAAVEEDAESCCGSSDWHGRDQEKEEEEEERRLRRGDAHDKEEEDGKSKSKSSGMMCRRCGERESCVLVLPCRHLCVCTVCGSSLQHACPVCNSNMNATVHVNMSSS